MGLGRRVGTRSGRGLALAGAAALGVASAPLAAALAQPAAPETAKAPAPRPSGPGNPAPRPAVRAAPPPASPAPAGGGGEDDEATAVSEITVNAAATPYFAQAGAVAGDIQPEVQLNAADVQSYGVSTLTELLDELAPQTNSGQGRGGETPVVLLNGKRISGFQEVRDIPTEAILRVDILPEEVALKYGFTADQKVVNFVLRPRFRSTTHELTGGGPTAGGEVSGQYQADRFQVRGDNRFNLDVKLSGNTDLTYASRGLTGASNGAPYALMGNVVAAAGRGPIDPALTAAAGRPVFVAGVPAGAATSVPSLAAFAAAPVNADNLGQYRDLNGAAQNLSANLVVARALGAGYSAAFNASFSANGSQSMQGLPSLRLVAPAGNPYSPFSTNVGVDRYVDALGPLNQDGVGWSGHLGGTLNKADGGRWRFNLTAAYDHNDSLTETESGLDLTAMQTLLNANSASFNPYGAISPSLLMRLPNFEARSISDSVNINAVAYGSLLKVPAGDLNASLKAGDSQSNLASASFRLGLLQAVELTRNDANLQVNLDMPLTSRRRNFLPWMGELTVNTNLANDWISGFGSITRLGYGLNWTPIPAVRLVVSNTRDEAAPSVSQQAGPTVLTPNVTTYDFVTGQTLDITTLSGGNPNLTRDTRNVFKVGLTLKPWSTQQFTFTANYTDQRTDHPIGGFPAVTQAIEAAFPSRFVRDANGDLVEEDERPLNLDWTRRQSLRYGFNFSHTIGKPPARPARPPGPPPEFRRRDGQGQPASQAQAQGQAQGSPTPPADGQAPPANPPQPSLAQLARQGRGQGGPGFGGGRGGFGGPGGGPPGGGGRGGAGGGNGGPRIQIAVYDTVYFTDQTLLAENGPLLDFLNGSPNGKRGAQPINSIDGQLGYTDGPYGARLSATWVQGTTVNASSLSPVGTLTFSDLTTINLRLFVNFANVQGLARKHPWLRGSRLTFNLYNVFDQQLRVRDATGATPIGYSTPFLDATGRTFAVTFRKLIF